MLSIGELDRRISIMERDISTDEYGEKTKTWSTVYTVWAKVDWKTSDRKEESQEQVQATDVVFYVRNLGITVEADYGVLFEEETYIIHGIKQIDGRERFLELETKIKDNQ